MNSFRILIASSDPEYDRALAGWLRKKCPPMETACMDPDRWFEETENSFSSYDRILLGGNLKQIHQGPNVRRFSGFGPESQSLGDDPDLFRPGEEIFRDLFSPGKEEPAPRFFIRTIGMYLSEEDPALENAAEQICSGLCRQGRRLLRADLREEPRDPGTAPGRIGARTWDDFLYNSIYGRVPDLLTDPADYGIAEESGPIWFPRVPGPNPYGSLSERELRRMFGRIREHCPLDYFAALLPREGSAVFAPSLNQMDLTLVLYREGETDRLSETMGRLKASADVSRRFLEVCCTSREQESDVPGFLLHLNPAEKAGKDSRATRTKEDLAVLTEFIDDSFEF